MSNRETNLVLVLSIARVPSLCHLERAHVPACRDEGESKDPDTAYNSMPIQGVFTKMPTPVRLAGRIPWGNVDEYTCSGCLDLLSRYVVPLARRST
jgi:hypothetical protein